MAPISGVWVNTNYPENVTFLRPLGCGNLGHLSCNAEWVTGSDICTHMKHTFTWKSLLAVNSFGYANCFLFSFLFFGSFLTLTFCRLTWGLVYASGDVRTVSPPFCLCIISNKYIRWLGSKVRTKWGKSRGGVEFGCTKDKFNQWTEK